VRFFWGCVFCVLVLAGCGHFEPKERRKSSLDYADLPSIIVPGQIYAPVYKESYVIPGSEKKVRVVGRVRSGSFVNPDVDIDTAAEAVEVLRKQKVVINELLYRTWELVQAALFQHRDIMVLSEDQKNGRIIVMVGQRQFRFDMWQEGGFSHLVVLSGEGLPIDNSRIVDQLLQVATHYLQADVVQ